MHCFAQFFEVKRLASLDKEPVLRSITRICGCDGHYNCQGQNLVRPCLIGNAKLFRFHFSGLLSLGLNLLLKGLSRANRLPFGFTPRKCRYKMGVKCCGFQLLLRIDD